MFQKKICRRNSGEKKETLTFDPKLCFSFKGDNTTCMCGSFDIFLVDEGIDDSNTAIKGPSLARQACRRWPNIECWLNCLLIFQGILTSIANKPYFL